MAVIIPTISNEKKRKKKELRYIYIYIVECSVQRIYRYTVIIEFNGDMVPIMKAIKKPTRNNNTAAFCLFLSLVVHFKMIGCFFFFYPFFSFGLSIFPRWWNICLVRALIGLYALIYLHFELFLCGT